MALRNQPYIPLYVQDYLTDEKLNMCSAASQGIFIKIMCMMHKSDEYGIILLKQKDKQNQSTCLNFAAKLARLLPFDKAELKLAIQELVEENVLYINGDKLYQKRMISDNKISIIRAESGSKGGKKTQRDFAKAKVEASTEDESENEIDNETKERKEKEFAKAWNLYGKKQDRKRALQIWMKLNDLETGWCLKAIPKYVESTPDKRYRKMFKTYLNNRSWENEVDLINIKKKVTGYLYQCPNCKKTYDKPDRRDYHYRCEENKCQEIQRSGGEKIGIILEWKKDL